MDKVIAPLHNNISLTSMDIAWKNDFLGYRAKEAIVSYSDNHAAVLNEEKPLMERIFKRGEYLILRKTQYSPDGIVYAYRGIYHLAELSRDGAFFGSLEVINNKRKIFNKYYKSYRVVFFKRHFEPEIFIIGNVGDAVRLLRRRMREYNNSAYELNYFDIIMRRYFSFYK